MSCCVSAGRAAAVVQVSARIIIWHCFINLTAFFVSLELEFHFTDFYTSL